MQMLKQACWNVHLVDRLHTKQRTNNYQSFTVASRAGSGTE